MGRPRTTARGLRSLLVAGLLVGGRLVAGPAQAQGPSPVSLPPDCAPTDVIAVDEPGDDSGAMAVVTWTAPQARRIDDLVLVGYRLYRSKNDGPFVGLLDRIDTKAADLKELNRKLNWVVAADVIQLLWAARDRDWQAYLDRLPALLDGYRIALALQTNLKELPAHPTDAYLQVLLGDLGGLMSFQARTDKLWTWDRYRFEVAALYAPARSLWYMAGEVVPKPSGKPDEPQGPPVLAREGLSEVSTSLVTRTFKLGAIELPVDQPVVYTRTAGRWYFTERTNALVAVLVFSLIVIWYISHARRGKELYIRPIAGIEAVDDAIGRATEMGKPILFVPGLSSLGDIATITAMTILGRVARRTAEYETPLLVPNIDPLVMLAAREIVREAYIDAGKPDAYREQDITYTTGTQFAYVAAVDGIMMRERPAANFYMGAFAAESLILAETGAQTGAIQIAGTDADTQIPFFVTACDFCLMGEELYAATAYLSREPLLLAQLKAQDVGKAFIAAVIALGTVGASVAAFLAASGGGKAAAELIVKCIGWLRGG